MGIYQLPNNINAIGKAIWRVALAAAHPSSYA